MMESVTSELTLHGNMKFSVYFVMKIKYCRQRWHMSQLTEISFVTLNETVFDSRMINKSG